MILPYFAWICLLATITFVPVSAKAETLSFKSEVTPSNLTATLTGDLSFPKGAGPFPVVILLHPCGGLVDPVVLAALQAHAVSLRQAGFAILILDSYGPRNLNGGKACEMRTASFRKDDAFNAMAVLQKNTRISKDNIFAMGLSDGGIAALMIATGSNDARFNAVAAFYPGCNLLGGIGYAIRSPLLVFVAGKDDWAPPGNCLTAKSANIVTGAEFDVINYPNAQHGFDQQRTFIYKGHTLAYSTDATADSKKRVREFFVQHLSGELKKVAPAQ